MDLIGALEWVESRRVRVRGRVRGRMSAFSSPQHNAFEVERRRY